MRNDFNNADDWCDCALNSQTGEITGNAISLAWMISKCVLKRDEVLPRMSEELRNAVLENLEGETK